MGRESAFIKGFEKKAALPVPVKNLGGGILFNPKTFTNKMRRAFWLGGAGTGAAGYGAYQLIKDPEEEMVGARPQR